MALNAKRLEKNTARTYVLMGDGESVEGSVWESVELARQFKLDNLCAIVDYNGIQLDDHVRAILDLEPLVDKWKAFRWPVLEIDGHDLVQLDTALDEAETVKGAPSLIVAHTVKGKGVSFMEGDPEWHGKAPKPAEAIRAVREIAGDPLPAWAEPIVAELGALGSR